LVSGFRVWVSGFWFLVVNFWLLVSSFEDSDDLAVVNQKPETRNQKLISH
jgi:hypothetical protein